jgi:NAD dependent epimerase/dehydratase family enzyme
MSKNGGALGKLYPIFFLGGGGIVGSGQQYFTFISARDAARALIHTIETPSLRGPVNVCAPVPCTNAAFTSAFGKVLGRPTILPLPGFAVSTLFGEMGDEMLLGGVRATPAKLVESGFQFLHPTIAEALQSAVDETI